MPHKSSLRNPNDVLNELLRILGEPQVHREYGRTDMLDVELHYYPAEKVKNAIEALRATVHDEGGQR